MSDAVFAKKMFGCDPDGRAHHLTDILRDSQFDLFGEGNGILFDLL
jgi:hypothetical protein